MKTLTSTNEHDRANAERTIARSLKFSQQQREAARVMNDPAKHMEDINSLLYKICPAEQDDGSFSTAVSKDTLTATKIVIDTKLKLLNKSLPDLKIEEIVGNVTHNHNHSLDVSQMSKVEKVNRLLKFFDDQKKIATSENVIDVTPITTTIAPPENADDLPFL